MRITILNQFYTPDISPTAALAASLAEYWSKQGHDVTVIASQGGYVKGADFAKSSKENGVQIYRAWTPALGKKNLLFRAIDYGFFNLGAFWRSLRLPKQDLIIPMTTPPWIGWAGVLHRILHRTAKISLWCMDVHPEMGEAADKHEPTSFISRFLRTSNRKMFKHLDHIVCLDQAMVDLLKGEYIPENKDIPVNIIPNWEPIEKYPKDAKYSHWQSADELGIRDKFIVLYSGNLGVIHQFDDLLDAARKLQGKPIVFLINGGGSRKTELEKIARAENLDNFVFGDYLPVDELQQLLHTADLAYISLRNRGTGTASPSKLHGNLAMRLPVMFSGPVDTNVDYAINKYDCGKSLREGDVDGMIEFLEKMINDPQRHKQLCQNARNAFDLAYNDKVVLPQFQCMLDIVTKDK